MHRQLPPQVVGFSELDQQPQVHLGQQLPLLVVCLAQHLLQTLVLEQARLLPLEELLLAKFKALSTLNSPPQASATLAQALITAINLSQLCQLTEIIQLKSFEFKIIKLVVKMPELLLLQVAPLVQLLVGLVPSPQLPLGNPQLQTPLECPALLLLHLHSVSQLEDLAKLPVHLASPLLVALAPLTLVLLVVVSLASNQLVQLHHLALLNLLLLDLAALPLASNLNNNPQDLETLLPEDLVLAQLLNRLALVIFLLSE